METALSEASYIKAEPAGDGIHTSGRGIHDVPGSSAAEDDCFLHLGC